MISLRTAAVLFAAGTLALSAGFATFFLTGGMDNARSSQLSDESDVEGLLAARFPDLQGVETTIGSRTEKVLVINFWATWCVPCREEIPDFVRLQSEYEERGVRFIGIAAERADKVPSFARELGINYPILIGDYAALQWAKRMGDKISALPFTVVLDSKRKVVHRELGVLKPERLRKIFADVLRQG